MNWYFTGSNTEIRKCHNSRALTASALFLQILNVLNIKTRTTAYYTVVSLYLDYGVCIAGRSYFLYILENSKSLRPFMFAHFQVL